MGAESYNRQLTANPVQSFYATDPAAFCPQDPASPNSVAIAEFCDFNGPDSKYQYNRAGLNAQSSYLLPNFGASAGYQYEVENASIPFLAAGHVRRNNQAGFLDFRYSPHPRASLNFGVRAEANGYFGTRVVPRAGASLALLQGRGFWGETRLLVFYAAKASRNRVSINSSTTSSATSAILRSSPRSSKTWSIGIEQSSLTIAQRSPPNISPAASPTSSASLFVLHSTTSAICHLEAAPASAISSTPTALVLVAPTLPPNRKCSRGCASPAATPMTTAW
jgi:hypothetical protein